jgi:hypothetical protein
MASKIHELKPRLFEAGEVSITAEAFKRLKEAGVDPQKLLERHTRGDWPGYRTKWVEKGYPIWSVYRLHPTENKVGLVTEADFSKTKIINWPDGTRDAPLLPLNAMEAGYQVTKRAMEKGSFARSVMDGTASKRSKGKKKPRGKNRDISR